MHAAQTPPPTPLQTPPPTSMPDPQHPAGGMGARRPDVERAAAVARAELCRKLEAFSAELARTSDVEGAGKLANGVSACASALAQVCALQMVNGSPRTE